MSIGAEHGPARETRKLVHSDVAEWRWAAGVLVVVNQETVFCVDADLGFAGREDARDLRQPVVEDVGDLFCEVLVGVLRCERGGRESVAHDGVNGIFGRVRERGRKGLKASDAKRFFERRAETWRVCEVDKVVDLGG